MRIILALLMFFAAFLDLHSQDFGIKSGITYSTITNLKPALRAGAGLFIQTKDIRYFLLELNYKNIAGIVPTQDSFSVDKRIGESDINYNFHYIEMPLIFGIRANKKIAPFINIGLSPSYLFKTTYKLEGIKNNNRINVGLILSPGVNLSEHISVEARLTKSIIEIYNDSDKRYNYYSLSFLLGFKF